MATFLSYALERRISRHTERFGTGAIAGLAGPKASNNAGVPGSLIPLITLSISRSGGTAIMLGILIMFGMQLGPLLMIQSGDVVWSMIAGLILSNVFLLVSNILMIAFFITLPRLVQGYLASIVIALCLEGAFSLNYSLFNFRIALIFGMVGYLIRKNGYLIGPFIWL